MKKKIVKKEITLDDIYRKLQNIEDMVLKDINKPGTIQFPTIMPPQNSNLHYHGQMPCYRNPCIWC